MDRSENGIEEEIMKVKAEPIEAADSVEGQAQTAGKAWAKFPEIDFISLSADDDESHSEHWQGRNGGKASRRLRARKARQLKERSLGTRIEGN